MKIPKSVIFAGRNVKIEKVSNLNEERRINGQVDFDKLIILLATDKSLPIETTEQSLCHEATHYILDLMGERRLSENEKFVCTFSELMYQFIKQVEGE